MELDHLKLFLHIVDTGSVIGASKAAHLTQPAVSRALKLLEDNVGAPLFERQGRGVVLTAAGRALVPRARTVLENVEAAARTVRQAAFRGYSDLRLGTVDSVASYLVPRVFGPLQAQSPRAAVQAAHCALGPAARANRSWVARERNRPRRHHRLGQRGQAGHEAHWRGGGKVGQRSP